MMHGERNSHKCGRLFGWLVGLTAIVLLVSSAAIYSGFYNVGADVPHSKLVYWLLERIRTRSVSERAEGIKVSADLTSDDRVRVGAGLYAEMCAGCHLTPEGETTEIAQGLYPAAPALSDDSELSPQEQFWVIKHGIKASGMAAWGKTHSDKLIWDMVAFLQKLPGMSATQYRELIEAAPAGHDEIMEYEAEAHDHTGHEH